MEFPLFSGCEPRILGHVQVVIPALSADRLLMVAALHKPYAPEFHAAGFQAQPLPQGFGQFWQSWLQWGRPS